MIAIRIPKSQRGRAWRAMVEIAPVRLVANDPIYEVLPAHLELLDARGLSYEVVRPRRSGISTASNGSARTAGAALAREPKP